jgi:hypothetical protein
MGAKHDKVKKKMQNVDQGEKIVAVLLYCFHNYLQM